MFIVYPNSLEAKYNGHVNHILEITLEDGSRLLVNEDQVCIVEPVEDDMVRIHMSNGRSLLCRSPTYLEWENDKFFGNRK